MVAKDAERPHRLVVYTKERRLYDVHRHTYMKQAAMLEEMRAGERFDVRKGSRDGPPYTRETYLKIISRCERKGKRLIPTPMLEEALLGHWETVESDDSRKDSEP
jgi:polyhydroxyalkanoate synthesis regulator protein